MDLSMSDNSRQLASDMYYFVPRSCVILIDSEIRFRLYFATVLCRERRRRKPSSNRQCWSVGEPGKPKKASNLCFRGATVRFQDCMLQDEVVRTWSGDFQKSSQHP